MEQAVADRIVKPGYSFVLDAVEELSLSAGLERAQEIPLERLRRYLIKERLPVLIRLQGEQVDAFVEMANEVTREAMVAGWSRSRYVASVERLAGLFGTDGFKSVYADVWYSTYVLNASYNEAQLQMVQGTVAGRLFPFLRLKTQRDERVRDSHRAVDGLTAHSFWSGWSRFTPPLDWNCRCRLEKISWLTARRLGLFQRISDGSSILMP